MARDVLTAERLAARMTRAGGLAWPLPPGAALDEPTAVLMAQAAIFHLTGEEGPVRAPQRRGKPCTTHNFDLLKPGQFYRMEMPEEVHLRRRAANSLKASASRFAKQHGWKIRTYRDREEPSFYRVERVE